MSEKVQLSDVILEEISAGRMMFGDTKVADYELDGSRITLILETGDRYYRDLTAREVAHLDVFKMAMKEMVHDDDWKATADPAAFRKEV